MSIEWVTGWINLLEHKTCWVLVIVGAGWYVKSELANRKLINDMLRAIEGRNGVKST